VLPDGCRGFKKRKKKFSLEVKKIILIYGSILRKKSKFFTTEAEENGTS